MKNILRAIILFLFVCLTSIPSEAISVPSMLQNIPSLDYIVSKNNAEITLVQGDEDYYVVYKEGQDYENIKNNSDMIFGEDAITEDNILKHYIFNKSKLEKNRAYTKISPVITKD